MRFSRYIWELWAESAAGKAARARWRSLGAELRGTCKLKRHPTFSEAVGFDVDAADDELWAELTEARVEPEDIGSVIAECRTLKSVEPGRPLFDKIVETFAGGEGGNEAARQFANSVTSISLGLWAAHPDNFVPYSFRRRFDIFREICDELGIDLPEPPGEKSWDRRVAYYADVNDALLEFGERHGLAPTDVAALLHDFGSRHVRSEEDEELPEPRAVWWHHGGVNDNGDFDLLDAADASTRTTWQGNDQARRGDIAVVWCLSPRSCDHSIWRITRDGHSDPFMYFSRIVEIGHPITGLPPLSFADLSAHPSFSQWPAVRAHFQGASGRELPHFAYEALLDVYSAKKADVRRLPKVEPLALPDGLTIRTERDVEEKLLEPLLREIGYDEAVWRRQLPVQMGRGERVFPDYALGIVGKRGEERCALVAEAKLTVPTQRSLHRDFRQARSYALRLEAKAVLVASREGVWVSSRTPAGFAVPQMSARLSWPEASTPTGRAAIARVVGARALR